MISGFHDEYDFLSNFYPCNITIPETNIDCATVEHAYQASKTLNKSERMYIAKVTAPGLAKKLGQELVLRPNWDRIKLYVMYELVFQKFSMSQQLKSKLIGTWDQELVEENKWGDKFWGRCDEIGDNHLGIILMRVRDRLNNIW